MTEQVIAFLIKYQEMRKAQKEYFKSKQKMTLIRAKQLELELDKEAEQIKAALQLK